MISGRVVVAATFVAALDVAASAQKPPSFQNINLVDLDVVVTDGDGRSVIGLLKEEFDVRENGKRVELKTFSPVLPAEGADPDGGRSLVILLDDVTMPPEAVDAVRDLANYLAMQARPIDDVNVISFRKLDDLFGDRTTALARIAEYKGAPIRYAPAGSPEDVLKRVTGVSRQLESAGRRRTVLVCIGAQHLCNVTQPNGFGGTFYNEWKDAVGAAARAHVSVYALLRVPASVSGTGLVEATGGAVFRGVEDMRPVLDRLWQDAGQHYLLGYSPPTSSKDLHTISVRVTRRGVKVFPRRQRGN
jgi:hypothetical protein